MAIYAFDGTWQEDEYPCTFDPKDTNVSKFLWACGLDDPGDAYTGGVGTRLGPLGRVMGGVFGMGGRSRVRDMLKVLKEEFEEEGDEKIIILGFSRGAALALHFANLISKNTFTRKADGEEVKGPPIAFLGLFDTVASFGLSFDLGLVNFQGINLGWKLDVPENVECCRHALSFHERRETFRHTRLDPEHTNPNVEEVWFKGGHGDVGGGNGNCGLSSIALDWMMSEAMEAVGLQFVSRRVDTHRSNMNASADVKLAKNDLLEDPPRATLPGDRFHPSLCPLLGVGEERTVKVCAKERYASANCILEEGGKYVFSFSGEWSDGCLWPIPCKADGWTRRDIKRGPVELLIAAAEGGRRVPDAHWFELCGTLGRNEDGHFRIGNGEYSSESTPYVATATDALFLFANDVSMMDFNNKGKITVTIRRVG